MNLRKTGPVDIARNLSSAAHRWYRDNSRTEIQKIMEGARYLNRQLKGNIPPIAVTLGSGLGDLAKEMRNDAKISYKKIPYFPYDSHAPAGHAQMLHVGELGGTSIVALEGRVHTYSKLDPQIFLESARYVRMLRLLGVKNFILSTAAGSLNPKIKEGDIVFIKSCLNFTGLNPLIGPNLEIFGTRFPAMNGVDDPFFRKVAFATAAELGLELKTGVYNQYRGPNYEFIAEVEFLRRAGADLAGMSTVPEVMTILQSYFPGEPRPADYVGDARLLALSLCTNPAAQEGVIPNHQEVQAAAEAAKIPFGNLVKGVVSKIN